MRGLRVQCLVGELRSYMLQNAAKHLKRINIEKEHRNSVSEDYSLVIEHPYQPSVNGTSHKLR